MTSDTGIPSLVNLLRTEKTEKLREGYFSENVGSLHYTFIHISKVLFKK